MVFVNIDNDSTDTKVEIPSSAIIEDKGTTKVFVFDPKNETVKSRNVTVRRLHRNGMAEVTSGLEDGETIVTAGVHHISDGQKAKPMPKSSKSNVGGLL